MIIEWTEIYKTGIKEIDKQHKELFDLIRQLRTDFTEDTCAEKDEVKKILDFILDYSVYHFSYEETYLKDANPKLLAEHKIIHSSFKSEVDKISIKLQKTGEYKVIKLYYFLTYWLQEHIAGDDKKILATLN